MKSPRQAAQAALYATPLNESVLAGACVLAVFGFHALYGGLEPTGAMLMVLTWSALLFACLAIGSVRKTLSQTHGLIIPGLLFSLVVVAGLVSLTPWAGGEKPVWGQIGRSAAATVDASATITEVVKLMGLGSAFLVGAALGAADQRARRVCGWLVYAGALFALGAGALSVMNIGYHTQSHRLEAMFLNPNTAGTVFGALLMLSLALVMRGYRRTTKGGGSIELVVALAAAASIGAAVVLTASRGALVATTAGAVLFLFTQLDWRERPITRMAFSLVGLIFVGAALISLADPRVIERMATVGVDAHARTLTWQTHWHAFQDSPVWGYGLGSFDVINKALLTPDSFKVLWDIRSAGNVYLQWLVEGGVIAAAPMFLCVLVIIVFTAIGAVRRKRMQPWLGALLALDLVFLLHGLTDFALQTPSVAAFWALMLGLQLALADRASRPGEDMA